MQFEYVNVVSRKTTDQTLALIILMILSFSYSITESGDFGRLIKSFLYG